MPKSMRRRTLTVRKPKPSSRPDTPKASTVDLVKRRIGPVGLSYFDDPDEVAKRIALGIDQRAYVLGNKDVALAKYAEELERGQHVRSDSMEGPAMARAGRLLRQNKAATA